MEDAQKQLVDKLKTATNILVTVSRDPSVDQLAALIGLTLLLNKEGKHAAAVFSGRIPSTIEFLQPDETIEKNTDSLRDFIIALDKNKADKLRYKVEDNVVRIFITPYKTSITEADFEFSQGDFNVDLVIALGVQEQGDLDEAIVSHGRILHDATVASINISSESELGTINWHQPDASSLSELVTKLGQTLDASLLDEQIATALLTGIVAETDRFSNERTSSQTMSISSALMAAGANQQLVASKLMDAGALASISLKEEHVGAAAAAPQDVDGALAINHGAVAPEPADLPTFELPTPNVESLPSEDSEPLPEITGDNSSLSPGAKMITEPPTMGGTLTANSTEEGLDPVTDPMSMPLSEDPQLLQHSSLPTASPPPAGPSVDTSVLQSDDGQTTTAPPLPVEEISQPTDEVRTSQTLTQLEEAVASPHLQPTDLGEARSEVEEALNQSMAVEQPQAAQSLNSQQLGPELHPSDLSSDPTLPTQTASATDTIAPAQPTDTNSPPPVPPPIPFQFGNPPPSQ
jgi:hypothetical protein